MGNRFYFKNFINIINITFSVILDGLEVVGCPVGSQLFVEAFVLKKVKKWEKALTLVENLNPLVSFPLLKYCIHSRAGYLSRVVQYWKCEAIWKRADASFEKTLDTILAIEGVGRERLKVMAAIQKLPCRLGGLGLTSLSDIAPVAWKTSWLSAYDYIQKNWDSIGHLWEEKVWEEGNSRVFEDHLKIDNFKFGETTFEHLGSFQKELTKELFNQKADEVEGLLANNTASLALFKAQRQGGYQWLSYQFLGKKMWAKVFQCALSARLLFPHFSVGANAQNDVCDCKFRRRDERVNPNREEVHLRDPKQEWHAISCPAMHEHTIARHNALYLTLKRTLLRMIPHLQFEREWSTWNQFLQKRLSVDLRMRSGEDEPWYYIDFSFVNIASASNVKKATAAVVKDRETMKIKKYNDFLSTEQMRFMIPFVMDSAGNVGQLALNFLDKISKEFFSESEISVKNEVLAALQNCYWECFYQFKEVFNRLIDNPSVRQRISHNSSYISQ